MYRNLFMKLPWGFRGLGLLGLGFRDDIGIW